MEFFKLKTFIMSIQNIKLAFYHIHLAAFVFTPHVSILKNLLQWQVLYQLPGFALSILLRNDSDWDNKGKLVDSDCMAASHPFFY